MTNNRISPLAVMVVLVAQSAKVMIERWHEYYNTVRPHSSLGYKPPAPEVISWPASPDSLPVARPAIPPLAETRPIN